MGQMAGSEEVFGKIYGKLAKQFKELGRYYTGAAEDLKDLEQDEYDHRDAIMRELPKIEDLIKIKKIIETKEKEEKKKL